MKIRRYLGHDCNSHEGFNNGQYIDDDFIEVENHEHAMKLCLKALREHYKFNKKAMTELDNGYEVITGYYDGDGNELTRAKYMKRDNENDSYRYVYCTFEEDDSDDIVIQDWAGNELFRGHRKDKEVLRIMRKNKAPNDDIFVYWVNESDERNVYEFIDW